MSAAKNTHVNELLAQTDQCLQSLFKRLTVSTGVASHSTAGNQGFISSMSFRCPSYAGKAGAAPGNEQLTWDDITFSADIPAAPSMLTGELRDYQLQARHYDCSFDGLLPMYLGHRTMVRVP